MKDIVKTELISIQGDYLELLKKIKSNIETNWEAAIDEINLFWIQKKRFITFVMENYFSPYNTFLFTAASFLDYDDKEHFPFVACGDVCIVDDTICGYGNMVNNVDDIKFNETIKNQLLLGIDDNIKVLENCSHYIYILPISFLSEDSDAVAMGAEGAFLSLFNVKYKNMQEYFQDINSFEDLDKHLKKNLRKSILLYKDDNVELSLKERMNNYIEDASDGIDFNNKSCGFIFMYAVYSNIAQALNVIMLCTKYKVIPYLRYNVAFFYFTHFILNPYISKIESMDEIIIKSQACYLIYKMFDKDAVDYSDFSKFAQLARDKDLFNKVLEKVYENRNNFKLKQSAIYTEKELRLILSELHSSVQ